MPEQMNLSDALDLIAQSKTDIKASVENKGGTIGEDLTVYNQSISNIQFVPLVCSSFNTAVVTDTGTIPIYKYDSATFTDADLDPDEITVSISPTMIQDLSEAEHLTYDANSATVTKRYLWPEQQQGTELEIGTGSAGGRCNIIVHFIEGNMDYVMTAVGSNCAALDIASCEDSSGNICSTTTDPITEELIILCDPTDTFTLTIAPTYNNYTHTIEQDDSFYLNITSGDGTQILLNWGSETGVTSGNSQVTMSGTAIEVIPDSTDFAGQTSILFNLGWSNMARNMDSSINFNMSTPSPTPPAQPVFDSPSYSFSDNGEGTPTPSYTPIQVNYLGTDVTSSCSFTSTDENNDGTPDVDVTYLTTQDVEEEDQENPGTYITPDWFTGNGYYADWVGGLDQDYSATLTATYNGNSCTATVTFTAYSQQEGPYFESPADGSTVTGEYDPNTFEYNEAISVIDGEGNYYSLDDVAMNTTVTDPDVRCSIGYVDDGEGTITSVYVSIQEGTGQATLEFTDPNTDATCTSTFDYDISAPAQPTSISFDQNSYSISNEEGVTSPAGSFIITDDLDNDVTENCGITFSPNDTGLYTSGYDFYTEQMSAGTYSVDVTADYNGLTATATVDVDITAITPNYMKLSVHDNPGNDGNITITIPASVTDSQATSLSYSTDGTNWTDTIVDNTEQVITIPVSAGDEVYLKGIANTWALNYTSGNCTNISSTVDFNVSGNIMSLLYDDNHNNVTSFQSNSYYIFCRLFENNTHLIYADSLELPATTLANGCYENMFAGCTSLTTAPALPATELITNCYREMFAGCTSLVNAQAELPATTLASSCYYGMFNGCTSLTSSPVLPAEYLTTNCYYSMFSGCSSLESITMLAEDITANNCLRYWVENVAASGTFTKSGNQTSLPTGVDGIPSGWTVVDYVPQ